MQQPDGISVQYLCYKMQNLAWKKYAIARKIETGTIDKVGANKTILRVLKMMSLFMLLNLWYVRSWGRGRIKGSSCICQALDLLFS